MVLFFRSSTAFLAVNTTSEISKSDINKLKWLFSDARFIDTHSIEGIFVGPRKEMITPWSTNAVEITQNMGISGIIRIEEFLKTEEENPGYDPMLQQIYHDLDQDLFTIDRQPEPVLFIDNITAFNIQEGLALSDDEIGYLENLGKKLGRKLTDSEIFGFSQVNSEHCRHKIPKPIPTGLFRPIKTIVPSSRDRKWNSLHLYVRIFQNILKLKDLKLCFL